MRQKEQSLQSQIRLQILALINRMDFEYNTRLPSETQLAAKLQVSRSTIRSVLTELETEGKIIRRHGSGTYVNPQALGVETTIYPQMNMYDLICKNGYEPGMQVLSFRNAPAGPLANRLNLFPNDPITEIHSIYSADGVPCMYCIDTVDAQRFSGVNWKEQEQHAGSIYDFIRSVSDVDITWDIIRLLGAHSGQRPELQTCFSVPEGQIKPLILMEITNFDDHNQPSLLGNIYVDTNRIQLNLVRDLSNL